MDLVSLHGCSQDRLFDSRDLLMYGLSVHIVYYRYIVLCFLSHLRKKQTFID